MLGFTSGGNPVKAAEAVDQLWDINKAERLRKLHEHYPDLLSYEEQRVLAAISEFTEQGQSKPAFAPTGSIDWKLVKACWPALEAYAMGKGTEKDLSDCIHASKSTRKERK